MTIGTATQTLITKELCAQLAAACYEFNAVLPSGWVEITNSKKLQIGSTSGFDGCAYYNPETNEIVFAFRGSELSALDWINNNLDGFGSDNLPDQFYDAYEFYTNVIKNIQNGDIVVSDPSNLKIAFTGHSLGGGLAELMGALTECSSYQVYTYNAIGAAHLLDELEVWAANKNTTISNNYTNIHNYAIRGDLVAAIFNHIGDDIHYLNNPYTSIENLPIVIKGTLTTFYRITDEFNIISTHNKDNFLAAGVFNNETTAVSTYKVVWDLIRMVKGDIALTEALIPTITTFAKVLYGVVDETTRGIKWMLSRSEIYGEAAGFAAPIQGGVEYNDIIHSSINLCEAFLSLDEKGIVALAYNPDDKSQVEVIFDSENNWQVKLKELLNQGMHFEAVLANGSSTLEFAYTGSYRYHSIDNLIEIYTDSFVENGSSIFNQIKEFLNTLNQSTSAVINKDIDGNSLIIGSDRSNYTDIGNYIDGGIGNDTIYGGSGNDTLIGGEDSDTLYGGKGNDYLYGDDGNDYLNGGTGNDYLYGGSGNDIYEFVTGDGNDIINDSDGQGCIKINGQTITGAVQTGTKIYTYTKIYSDGDYTYEWNTSDGITGELIIKYGDDTITVNSFTNGDLGIYLEDKDSVPGNYYRDNAYGSNSTIIGSDGSDLFDLGCYTIAEIVQVINTTVYAGEGDDYFRVGSGKNPSGYTIYAGNGNNDIRLGEANSSKIYCGNGNDSIWSGNYNYIEAGAGDDDIFAENNNVIYAGEGNDTISLYGSDNTIYGGSGDNTYYITNTSNTIIENANDGIDTVYTTCSYTLGNNIENGVCNADGITLTGNGLDNHLRSYGYAHSYGANTLRGGLGNDNYYVGWDDVVIENAGEGNDTIIINSYSSTNSAYYLADNVENLIIGKWSSSSNIVYGNNQDNYFELGNNRNITLSAGKGNDTIVSNDSDNKYIFNSGDGNDTIIDMNGYGKISFGTGILLENISLNRETFDLIIRFEGNTNDSITIKDFYTNNCSIREFEFSNGSFYNYESLSVAITANNTYDMSYGNNYIYDESGDDLYVTGAGNDTIIDRGYGNDTVYSGAGNDYIDMYSNSAEIHAGAGDDTIKVSGAYEGATIEGGTGNDVIEINSSNNTFIFNLGDGQDIITTRNWNDSWSNYTDTIQFGEGISWSDLIFEKVTEEIYDIWGEEEWQRQYRGTAEHMLIKINGTDDQILIKYWFSHYESHYNDRYDYKIENFVFADGSVYTKNDIVFGTGLIEGTDSDDILVGSSGNDTIIGGQGNDTITDEGGNDTYIFNLGDGQDVITDFGGIDTIKLGEGITLADLEFIRVENPNYPKGSYEYGNYDNLLIKIKGTDDSITINNYYYKERDSYSYPETFNYPYAIENIELADGTVLSFEDIESHRTFSATEGDDYVYGKNTDDTYNNLNGNNTIIDPSGNDTYYTGDGDDYIFDASGDDLYITGAGNDTIIDIGYGNDTVYSGDGNDYIDMYSNSAEIHAGAGDDTIKVSGAYEGATIEGGTGNDVIETRHSNNVFIFNQGDGQDTITSTNDDRYTDTIQFSEGITWSDLIFEKVTEEIYDIWGEEEWQRQYRGTAEHMLIKVNGTDDQILIKYWFSHYENSYNEWYDFKIENFVFANGSVYTPDDIMIDLLNRDTAVIGTSENDTLTGTAGNNTFYGKEGNDYINNIYGGDDTYYFNIGDGNDTINEFGGNDTIWFGENIKPNDISITKEANNLVIRINNTNDSITILNWGSGYNYQIENLRFENGTILTNINSLITGYIGTDGNDEIIANTKDNLIIAGSGNDIVYADLGNDTIIGGKGNDTLYGEEGDDTYIFNIGDGNDVIYDYAGTDTVLFNESVNKENIAFYLNGNNLIIDYGQEGGQDIITINNQTNSSYAIEKLELSDGSYITNSEINQIIQNMTAYAANNSIEFTNINSVKTNEELMALISNSWHN